MIHPCFLGAGLATSLGTGVVENVAGLHETPRPAQIFERRVDGRTETIPYKPLRGSPLDARRRLDEAIDAVVEEALHEAQLTPVERRTMALCVGSSSFDISVSEFLYREELQRGSDALPLRSSSLGNIAEAVRARFGLRGEDFSFNTACTASANGLWYAARLIQSGEVDHALVLGVELLNDITALGLLGLGLLSRSTMRPFDSRRDGMVLGEACAALVLGRGDPGVFHWKGGANLCDTASMVAATTDGSTIAAVMRQTLADAGLDPDAIAAVKVHGTASPSNDDAEAAGLVRTFDPMPPVCALKPFIGHTLGASGLAELILFYRALEQGFLVSTPGIGDSLDVSGVALNQREQPVADGWFLLNSFGFGGNNTSLVIGRS